MQLMALKVLLMFENFPNQILPFTAAILIFEFQFLQRDWYCHQLIKADFIRSFKRALNRNYKFYKKKNTLNTCNVLL